jgi:hypothetical protein
MGRIQTLTRFEVLAGGSYSVDLGLTLSLSPLRRWLVVDPQVDILGFYVPHRHVYGDDWMTYIKSGIDEAATFTGYTLTVPSPIFGLPPTFTGDVPKWTVEPINMIWNRYFRVPSDDANVLDHHDLHQSDFNALNYGLLAARLKTPLTTMTYRAPDAADRLVPLSDATGKALGETGAGSMQYIDLTNLSRIQARYGSEQGRDWFAQRYNDVLSMEWGGRASPDADERPTLLGRLSTNLGGSNLGGNDDASLGTFQGRTAGQLSFRIPSFYAPEHGSMWILMLLRYPDFWELEKTRFDDLVDPSYLEFAGEGRLVAAEPPRKVTQADYFVGGSETHVLGYEPYGQWYRYQRPRIHPLYLDRRGFPIHAGLPNQDQIHYCQDQEHEDQFQSVQFGHWQAYGKAVVRARTTVPPPIRSLFAGVG